MLFAPFLLWAQEESLADLQQRAEAGDGAAMLRLSKVYAEGELGVEPDLQTAHNYLIRATEAGDPYAYFELANHYDTDPWGILEPDEEQQRYWLERAAEQNHLDAQKFGGFQIISYAETIRNKKESYAIGAHGIRLLEMAVEQGDMDTAHLLALVYSLGKGVKPNRKMSNYYYGVAARGGHQKAIEHCSRFNIPY